MFSDLRPWKTTEHTSFRMRSSRFLQQQHPSVGTVLEAKPSERLLALILIDAIVNRSHESSKCRKSHPDMKSSPHLARSFFACLLLTTAPLDPFPVPNLCDLGSNSRPLSLDFPSVLIPPPLDNYQFPASAGAGFLQLGSSSLFRLFVAFED